MNRIVPLYLSALLLWTVHMTGVQRAWGMGEYVLGGNGDMWAESGQSEYIDFSSYPGSIAPLRADPGRNLCIGLRERGGEITVYGRHAMGWEPPPEVKTPMIDGDPSTAYVHEPEQAVYHSGYETRPVEIDLGGQFPVNRIRFYPREEHTHHLITQYKLYLCDGMPENLTSLGGPKYHLIRHELENLEPVVDLHIPLQLVRFINMTPLNIDRTWELAEFEVYGEGYSPFASYVSRVIDFEHPVNWGAIQWEGQRDPDAKVLIHTRSGSDKDWNIYWRKTGIGDEEVSKTESGTPLTRQAYEALSEDQRGRITYDTEHWSFWCAPYHFEDGLEGVQIVSPGPRRYLQIKVDFVPTSGDGGQLDFIAVQYSDRVPASEVIGEISPTEVHSNVVTTFTYVVRPRINPGDTGFDTLEITTFVKCDTVRSLMIEGIPVAFSATYLENPERLRVHFPKVTRDQTRLDLSFDCAVLRYGTTFAGIVFDSGVDELSQPVKPGDVVDRFLGNTLSVEVPLGGRLISSVHASPALFTPNRDGAHEQCAISYTLLKLTGDAPVSIEIYDRAGRQVRSVYSGRELSGRYARAWDGKDSAGKLVSPGIYLYVIRVEADGRSEEAAGTIGVIY